MKVVESRKGSLNNSYVFILIFTALLSAFGPFVTDLYLPALPVISKDFATTTSMVQLSLTVSLVGLAVGQLFVGSLSDKYGRKWPLLLSLGLFLVATAGCLFAWNIQSFIAFRLVQGLAGAGGIVIAKSIAVDLYDDDNLGKFLSMLTAVNALAPISAPLLGGVMLKMTDWKGIFELLLVLGTIILIMNVFFRESLEVSKRLKGSVFKNFVKYRELFKNLRFSYHTLFIGFAMGAFFSYLSASPFIFQSTYNLSTLTYGLVFALNALGFMLGSRLSSRFRDHAKSLQIVAAFLFVLIVGIAILLILQAPVFLVEAGFFLMLISMGLIVPSGTALALGLERENAGSASAMIGFFEFLVGGVVSPLVGLGNVMHATAVMLVICGFLCWFFVRKAMKSSVG